MHKIRPCLSYTNVLLCTFFVPLILSFKCLQRCGCAANQQEKLMFLMAHGLSPGGEINMGKRLKPQAFFRNLLPSSSFPLQWSCRASTANSNSKPNPSGLSGILEPKTTHDYSNIDRGADVSNGQEKTDRWQGEEASVPFNHQPVKLSHLAHCRILAGMCKATTIILVLIFEMSLLGRWCQDLYHNKHPEKEESGPEARLSDSCYASLVRHGLATQPAHLGVDELEQLLRVAKHIISFVTVIRPRQGARRWR